MNRAVRICVYESCSLVRSLSALCVPVLGIVRPGEDHAAGSVRQLQRPRGECQRVRPGRPSRHGAGLRYVPVPVPLLRAPSFPVLTKHQRQEQPSSQRIPPVADWTLGRGEGPCTVPQPLKLLLFIHQSCFHHIAGGLASFC